MARPRRPSRVFELLLEAASGTHTKSQDHGYGDNECVPWKIGAVL